MIGLNIDGNETTQEITFRVEETRQGEGTAALRRETPNATVLRELDVRRKRRILIGRGEDCDVQLTSDRVSRHHCEVVYKDGHYELNDLGSTNGTYLNGTRVRNELLTDGAVINVPTQVFAFSGGMLHYHEHKVGISIELLDVYKTVKNRNTGKPLNIVDGTSMGWNPTALWLWWAVPEPANLVCWAASPGRHPAPPAASALTVLTPAATAMPLMPCWAMCRRKTLCTMS